MISLWFLLCDFLAFFASLREIKDFFSRKAAKDAKEEKEDENSYCVNGFSLITDLLRGGDCVEFAKPRRTP